MTRRNFMCDDKKWNKLQNLSYKDSVFQKKAVSASGLIRDAIDEYLKRRSKT